MTRASLPGPGERVAAADLAAPKARDLVAGLTHGQFLFAALVECRQAAGQDVVVLEVEVEVGQDPAADIRPIERLAVVFDPGDELQPRVLALRADFPFVSHLNLEAQEFPRSLCLFDERYAELRLRLTARMLLERIREWLRLTARGELHGGDQTLEPFLLRAEGTLILPRQILDEARTGTPGGFMGPPRPLRVGRSPTTTVLLANQQDDEQHEGLPVTMVTYLCRPRVHGPIRRTPASLADLHDLLAAGGDDLLGALRDRLQGWKTAEFLRARCALLLLIPLQRSAGAPYEQTNRWAFLSAATWGEVGEAVGRWEMRGAEAGLLLPVDAARRGDAVGLHLYNISWTLSRRVAAHLNGYQEVADTPIAVVGCGALGSQVFLNAYRTGLGQWTLIDSDHLLPHNLARHAVTHVLGAMPKSMALCGMVEGVFEGESGPAAIVADVLQPKEQADTVRRALHEAAVILDMSTSIPVARALALDYDSAARRASLFLNPRGTDLVLLLEDQARTRRLDALEMQYYRAVLQRDELARHLQRPEGGLQYGRTCRDVSLAIPGELVAVHAGTGARAIHRGLESPEAQILVWQADEDSGAVAARRYTTYPVREITIRNWRLVLDEELLMCLQRLRAARLPNETGGVLLGTLDLQRKIAYVIEALPSPPDSIEYPTCYIRGSQGLLRQVQDRVDRAGGQLGYIGEWHSHPDGAGVVPSDEDSHVLEWIGEELAADGHPPIMLIAGRAEIAVSVERIGLGMPPESVISKLSSPTDSQGPF